MNVSVVRLTNDASQTVRKLRSKLESYERAWANRAGWARRFVSTGLVPLDAVLPHGGLPCGAIVEILSDGPGVGALSLALRIAAQCSRVARVSHGNTYVPADHRSIVLLNTRGDFYPPAALQYGIDFDQLIVLHPRYVRDAFWAVDQSLRCSAVAAVIAPFTRLAGHHSRRLQLAARSSGCMGLILKPVRQRVKSFAAVQMLLDGSPASPAVPLRARAGGKDSYPCRITLLAVRGGVSTAPVWVDLYDETGIGSEHTVSVDRSAAKIA